MSASRYDGRRPEPPYPTPQADAMQRAFEVELIGDLLDALKAILPMAENYFDQHLMTKPERVPEIMLARAAIAKAES